MKRSHLIKPVIGYEYPTAVKGEGIYLYDSTGKKYLDGSSGAIAASIGHGVKEIITAMNQQAENLSFVYRSHFTSEPAEQLAEKLASVAPGDINWSFFVNSGSEATETALKIAIQHWQEQGIYTKTKILSRWMSYHGITLGALSMSGHVGRRERYVPLLEDWPSASAPYCYRCPFESSYPDCKLQCALELERAIQRMGQENVAAFIAEPIVGAAAGAIVPPEDYYQKVKEICEQHDVLLIADEVMTGIGRTGKMFALEHWGVIPDIITLGKGMSAGYTPMAATLVSDDVMKPIVEGSKSVIAGHTYSANPQSAATALAVLQYIEKEKVVENAEKSGEYLLKTLHQLAASHPIIGDIRGKGLLIGIEFVSDWKKKTPFPQEANVTNLVLATAMEQGLILYPAAAGNEGIAGQAILMAPPLVITRQEIDEFIQLLKKTLEAVEQDLKQKQFIK